MLQALLEDRFKLVVHRESKEHPVLALVVGKGGPKLKESAGDSPAHRPGVRPSSRRNPNGHARRPARMTMDMKNGGATINMGAKGIVTYSVNSQTMTMHITSTETTMAALADTLTQMMTQMGGGSGRQVMDMTGLKGDYEVSMDFSLADMVAAARAQGANTWEGLVAAALQPPRLPIPPVAVQPYPTRFRSLA